MRVILRWLVLSLLIYMLPRLVSGFYVEGFASAIAGAAVLAILNIALRPLLILLTLPLTILSLGFFLLILNALIFKWVGIFVSGFYVESFGTAFLCSLIITVISWAFDLNFKTQGGSRVIIVRGGDTEGKSKKVRDLN